MLLNLLPGLRELRTPLAAGYTLLLAVYFLIKDASSALLRTDSGPAEDILPLANWLGPAATLAALTFIAYLIGTIFEGTLYSLPRRRAWWVPKWLWRRLPNRIRRWLFFPRSLRPSYRAMQYLLESRFENALLTDPKLLDRLKDLERFERKEKKSPSTITEFREGRERQGNPQDPKRKTSVQVISAVQHDQLYYRASGEQPSESQEDPQALSWETWVHRIRHVDVDQHYDEVGEDLNQIPARLMGKEPELWSFWDRLRSEADFRFVMSYASAILFAVLAIFYQPLWILAFTTSVQLMRLSRRKQEEARVLLDRSVDCRSDSFRVSRSPQSA